MNYPKFLKNKRKIEELLSPVIITIFSINLTNCTGQIPGSFRFLQQDQTFSTAQDVNTKIDLLWVVDNSSSMDVHQEKLRNGFQNFATKYLKPTWDIRIAIITTDTYLANNAYSNYINSQISSSVVYTSTYISSLSWLSSYPNPIWNTSLVNLSTGAFTNGLKIRDLNPLWGPKYSLLQPGIHDGPMTSLCFEGMPYFLHGVTQCSIRDQSFLYSGSSHCLKPAGSESSLSQCVNTVTNDTVRSGKAIISTVPPTGTPGDSYWIQQLSDDFMINASVGSSGSGSERGMSSVLQLLSDNETSSTAFFRTNSLRGIIFLTDEDDQSINLPDVLPSNFSPNWGYACDQQTLLTDNSGSSVIDGNHGLCCNDPLNNCKYGLEGTSCPAIQIDGLSYNLGVCVDQTKLIPVKSIKQKLDTFFQALDKANSSADPNYFTAVITPLTGSSIENIQTERDQMDNSIGTIKVKEATRGDRYLALNELVGGGSLALDISSADYSAILEAIGNEIVQKKSSFTLSRAPTTENEMIVKILHQDGSSQVVPSSEFTISGKVLTFTNTDFVLSLSLTDKVEINYQPKTAY